MTKHIGIFEIQTKSGVRYRYRWRLLDGRQASKNFRTITEAKAFKREIETAKSRGGLTDSRRSKITFSEYAAEVTSRLTGQQPKTVLRRDGIMRNHLLPALGQKRIVDIRHQDLQDLVGEWSEVRGLAPNSIKNHKNLLNQIFKAAVREDIIIKNPVTALIMPKSRKMVSQVLTADECDRLIDAIDSAYEPLIQVALATGMRGGELVALNIGDLNLLKKEVRVTQSKTDAGVRSILLDDETISHIAQHLATTSRTGASPAEPLFTSPSGKRLNYGNFYRRIFKPACKAAGFPGLWFHDLRRTHATMLVALGIDAKSVQDRMGHSSIQTTLNFYAQPTDKGRKDAAGAFEQYRNGEGNLHLKRAN